jgi:hypothetical protein
MAETNEQVQAQNKDKIEITFRRKDGSETTCWVEPTQDGRIDPEFVRGLAIACIQQTK